jgi:hypothetical protein|uniref:Uncharacterized protein n=1 Tax=Populus trichocarpa TaxID=3694 RepID=A0A2K2BRI0_POPTR
MTYLQIKPERNIICMFHGSTHNPTDNYESNWRLRLLIHDMIANQTRVKHHLFHGFTHTAKDNYESN